MVVIALPLLVYQVSASHLQMNVVRALNYVPYLFLAFVIGALVDQSDKKRWLVGAAGLQSVSLVALAVLFGIGGGGSPLVYALVLALSVANYTYFNARSSAIKIALRPGDLGPAAAAFTSIGQAFQMLGPALAGVLLLFPSSSTALWAAAGVALVSLAALVSLDLDPGPAPAAEPLGARIAEGWRALRANRPMWHFTLVIMVTNCIETTIGITILQKAQALGLSPAGIGLLFSAGGGVGMAGSLLAPRLRPVLGLGRLAALSVAVTALATLAASQAGSAFTLGVALATSSFSIMVYSVLVSTLRQESTPVAVIGRVTGVTGSLYQLGAPAAVIGAGLLGEASGVGAVLLCTAAAGLFMAAVIMADPVLRRLR
jgi:sugar phosphate permease